MKTTGKTFKPEDLADALKTIASMASKIKKAQAHHVKGTPQYTLCKNRLKALRIAIALIKKQHHRP